MRARRLLARTAAVALVAACALPGNVRAQNVKTPVTAPSAMPMPNASSTPIPYPAYGTPAPDVAAQKPHAGIPTSVSLEQAVDIAVVQSPAFASQRAQYRAVFARYGAELGAVLPSVSASGGITKSYGGSNNGNGGAGSGGSGTGGAGSGSSGSNVTSERGTINLTQLIFDGGRAIAAIHSAKEADIAGKDTLVRQLQTLAFNVATAYYGVLQANATVSADALLVRQFELQERSVTAQIRTGAAARSDLAAAQFQTAQARAALVSAQGTAISAQATFATTLGLDADTAIAPQSLSSAPPQVKTFSYDQSLAQALELRPDYLAAIYTVQSSASNLRFAKLARFPSITASASDGTGRTLLSSPPASTPWSSTSSIGANISVPIYDQGLTNYNVAVAASQLDQAGAALQLAKLTVESDVRGALAGLVSARQSLVQTQAELNSAQVTLQATQARYHVGAATITDVVTAQANFATAERDYVNALYAERMAEERYTYAMGTSDLKLP